MSPSYFRSSELTKPAKRRRVVVPAACEREQPPGLTELVITGQQHDPGRKLAQMVIAALGS